ncbi:MAG: PorP/SprF family type IX secretion system membrane protein [Tenuifilaceae bacterium]|uniref:PorP/SprF family type IX secretion system membrane protein n=1 Tax=Perlabentimonas gracilis TaxID=2715279 RepID=UPI001408D8F4|nr:PorP/SprF family type IX secretion system membrane protein [Perlabentimonas gracilis]MDX9771672.1 PorP/SprF family type IX secretion system membrane protein [Tenuifilaceae bacterium]NHB69005.1 type IX secretion system membrane protein PorP/SprF [Perlabentimonas gracilis]
MRLRITILLGIMLLAGRVSAQQQPVYSQYMMNPFLINPAIAGYQGYTDFNLIGREQWLGYSEGPSTYALSGQTRILRTSYRNRSRVIRSRSRRRRPSGRVGIGGFIYNDQNGAMSRTGFQGTYAYHIYVRDIQYSAGVSLSAFQFRTNVTGGDLYDGRDPSLDGIRPGYSPDANVGFLVSGDYFYAGLSGTNLFQSAIQFGGGSAETAYRLLRHYNVIAGYKYQERRSDYGFEPSIMLAFTERLSWTLDINFKAYYKEDYWAGISYRTAGAVVTMFGMNYQNFYFGYAFDYGFGDIPNIAQLGSHEIMIGMRLGDSARRYRWLNRF